VLGFNASDRATAIFAPEFFRLVHKPPRQVRWPEIPDGKPRIVFQCESWPRWPPGALVLTSTPRPSESENSAANHWAAPTIISVDALLVYAGVQSEAFRGFRIAWNFVTLGFAADLGPEYRRETPNWIQNPLVSGSRSTIEIGVRIPFSR